MSCRPTFAFVTLLAAVFVVGCQTSSPAPASATPGRAVIATAGNGTTTIYLPASSGGGVQTLSTSGAPACPDCSAAAAKYFQGGTLEAKCPVCGANRLAAIGHN